MMLHIRQQQYNYKMCDFKFSPASVIMVSFPFNQSILTIALHGCAFEFNGKQNRMISFS